MCQRSTPFYDVAQDGVRMTNRRRLILSAAMMLALVALPVGLMACGSSDSVLGGNGDVVTETRTVSNFDALSVNNGARVRLAVGPAGTGDVDLAVTGDSNLLEFITTDVRDGSLRVSVERRVRSTGSLEVSGTVSALADVSVNNGASADIAGSLADLTVSANNGASIDGKGLEAISVEVDVDNGAQASVCATGSVTGAVANGAALTVRCGGNATDVDTSDGGVVSSSP